MKVERVYRILLALLVMSMAGCGYFGTKLTPQEAQAVQQQIQSFYQSVGRAFGDANAGALVDLYTPEISKPLKRDEIFAWGCDFFAKYGRADFSVDNLVFNDVGLTRASATLTYRVVTPADVKGNFGGTERDLFLKRDNNWLIASWEQLKPASKAKSAGYATSSELFKKRLEAYVVEFLKRNPTVSTYLGGAELDRALTEVDGMLRDHSAAALKVEDLWLESTQKCLQNVDPASLSADLRIDRNVALAQIGFILHQHQVRRYQERALDTYTDEPFRSIDWQLQGMTLTGDKTYGTDEEWSLVSKRLKAIPQFMKTAEEQLLAGIKSKNVPDPRMLKRNGIETATLDAEYFSETLPRLASERIRGPQRAALLSQIRDNSKEAAAAYRGLRDFIAVTFFEDLKARKIKADFASDRFAMGEAEYDWSLKNNFRIDKTASQLYEEALPIIEGTQRQMIDLAREIADTHGWRLRTDGPLLVRAVFDELSKDYPKSDAEMISWYRDAAFRLVDFARKTGVFEVPADYKLDVIETPPPLQAAIDGAAYYPAPPFKKTGVGHYYLTPTHNDIGALRSNNRSALPYLSSHEGFPGHDWHYKIMTKHRAEISGVRWLTPGAVEDSSSMWEDSMAAEGWAFYAEALMGEPQPGAPQGAYTPGERLYQLQGKLLRDFRVRIDTGVHTGKISYDDAVDLFSQIVDFLPGSCRDPKAIGNADKRASCKSSEAAIFRYSKWPTQAITYRLGKEQIYALRDEASKLLGDHFSAKTFHLLFMRFGTVPPEYFREELLHEIRAAK